MAVRYAPALTEFGFDGSISPNWQMVPVNGIRVLTITGAAGLIPRVRTLAGGAPPVTATVLTLAGTSRLILVGGRAAGRAWIEWVPSAGFSGPVTADFTLDISVKAEKTVRTAFHYVTDGRRQITSRRIADLDRLIAAANWILGPQANVTLTRKSAATLRVRQRLGDVVRFSRHLEGPPDNVDPAQHEWDVVTAGADATADFNVFFVKEYEQDTTPYHDDANAGTIASEKNCILEDTTPSSSETLAHETVHLLGVDAHSNSNTRLMGPAGRIARLLTRDEANTVNPSGT